MASKEITPEQLEVLEKLVEKARRVQGIIENYDQERVDRMCRAVAWAAGNPENFDRLGKMGVEESGAGDWNGRYGKRHKILGVLRDALRQKSVGMVEFNPEKGLARYAKPAGLIVSLIPMTNPELTPIVTAIYALKARDVVIFSPHPRTKKTTFEVVRLMREALKAIGEPEDFLQCVESPNMAMVNKIMTMGDLIMATGGPAMTKAAHSSGKPAYCSGAGNATMIFDETTDVEIAARNTRISKTSDFGSGCSADGNLVIYGGIYDAMVEALKKEGGYLATDEQREMLKKAMWDEEGHRIVATVAVAPQKLAKAAGFEIPEDRKFIMVVGDGIGKEHKFSGEKLTTLLTLHRYEGEFENALKMMDEIYKVGGRGHSCGIYSHDDDHIDRLALRAPVTRIMVRQPQSKANAGSAENGMPMTSSMGCGVWGGNMVSENISLKHYMQSTWVARPIMKDQPDEAILFGEFFDPSKKKPQ
ncbi:MULTISPECIES: aldehyde dehydrogenase family protein [Dethiosulfovibrio]|jgi:sulfoacetaldehyde dehydrogenase|uniref:Acetaldehyde dehydrogenase (Acetylating) n=3 Tax=Dethiosulfovibrio TaxID=47054 RepID=D2Z609_9BACT|nr:MULTISPECIES: aldehyde dehydrogenase family protein [Dethiosulfovibrio]MEA3285702.1 aldehyde dehydrogenase family protein [Synergistota bacterium]EFC90906.1 Acetaldehyde dehydrogenase (acetylating) [Dethiosulfovibrio peptidovorans DSM 11002]MCF4113262.1 aldehyde dehydrogenase family protein [Dethiosulfovibrio russensis]MCF4142326.1 aldehyde dehydrogenase family protein [Dethiosulfovibrio marinus]MCF4144634.1 aldehyde dehydrogenase family protein [Dethiosulfovibrio acidaminovorans]